MILATPFLDFSSLASSCSALTARFFSAPSLANFICSSLIASLLAFTDMDCQTNDGMSIGLLDPLYLLVLNPSAL